MGWGWGCIWGAYNRMFFVVYSYMGPLLGDGGGGLSAAVYGRHICRSNNSFTVKPGEAYPPRSH